MNTFMSNELSEINQLKETRYKLLKSFDKSQIETLEYFLSKYEYKIFFYFGGIAQDLNFQLQKLIHDNKIRRKNHTENFHQIRQQIKQFKDDLVSKQLLNSNQLLRLQVLREKLVEMSYIPEKTAAIKIYNFHQQAQNTKLQFFESHQSKMNELKILLTSLQDQLNVKVTDLVQNRLNNDTIKNQIQNQHFKNKTNQLMILQNLQEQIALQTSQIQDNLKQRDTLRSIEGQTETITNSIKRQHQQLYITMGERVHKLHQQSLIQQIHESPVAVKRNHQEIESLVDLQIHIREEEQTLQQIKDKILTSTNKLHFGRIHFYETESQHQKMIIQSEIDRTIQDSKEIHQFNEIINTIKFQEEQIKFLEQLQSGNKRRHRIKQAIK
ncbi:Hypothetical_protein [Hexamita inflata]|uniref:Hypothetical_protein n=1 Tax=Hexamita inflata TaxID=28002 RepID=A0ABP1HJT4_9EUKA